MEKLRIIIGGFIGLYPTGGVTWDYIQYPLGLKMMGHEVYYIEDTVQFPKYQQHGKKWDDASDSVTYLKQTMEHFGMGENWAYRDVASGNCYGLSLSRVHKLCKTADVFINISASTFMRNEYLAIPKRVLIDSDPMFTQIEYFLRSDAREDSPYRMKYLIDNHNYLFSFGENINKKDCKIPKLQFNWHTTRQPICLSYWTEQISIKRQKALSTVMNWSVNADLVYDNNTWGQKNIEFEKFVSIPKGFPDLNFELTVSNIPEGDKQRIINSGWKVLDPLITITNPKAYKNYIEQSGSEFSVAKETYIKSNSGWFSGRSACYLAAGKPVVAQETGWSKYIPCGKGLFAFNDINSSVDSIKNVVSDAKKHSKAAVEIAKSFFDSSVAVRYILPPFFKN